MSDIIQEQCTIIDRFDALMRLLPRDDSVSFNNSLRRIKSEIMNYLESKHQNLKDVLDKAKEKYALIESHHNEYLNNLSISVGTENVKVYVTIQAILLTIIFSDPKSVPSPKDLTKIYNAFVPRIQISNGYDLNVTIRNQWESQIESTSNHFSGNNIEMPLCLLILMMYSHT